MPLNRVWMFAVFVVTVSASLWSFTAQADPQPATICDAQLSDCLYYANLEDEEYYRQLRTDQCYQAYYGCQVSINVCGDGVCTGGETCSSCAYDCTFTSTSDMGTQTRNCSSTPHGTHIAYASGKQMGSFCYYPMYQINAVTCSVYRITQVYNSCGNPPYSNQESYEGTSTTYERVQFGWDIRFGQCGS